MKVLLLVYSTLFISQIYGNYSNPFTNSYRSDKSSTTITIPVTSNYAGLPNYTSKPVAPASFTTTTTVTPQPVVAQHTHTISGNNHIAPTLNTSVPPTYVPAPVYQHTQTAPTSPQNLTFQQIIQYLFSNSGQGLGVLFQQGATNFRAQCTAYCNALPSDPVCDTTNTLYRNKCELDCLGRTSNSNLVFGICCCDSADNDISDNTGRILYGTTAAAGARLCLTTCIDTCLGGETAIDIDSNVDIVVQTATTCAAPA